MARIPRLCDGQTLFLLGGGPSVAQLDLQPLQHCAKRVLVANDAYRLVPQALWAHHSDFAWWQQRQVHLKENFHGHWISGCAMGVSGAQYPEPILYLPMQMGFGLSHDGKRVCGNNAGYQLINIAYNLGAQRVVLLGYDLQLGGAGQNNWHDLHPQENPDTLQQRYQKSFIPFFTHLAENLPSDFEVINANPQSAIKCFAFCQDYRDWI